MPSVATLAEFFVKFLHFGAKFFVALAHLFELFFETWIVVRPAILPGALMVLTLHFLSAGAEVGGFVMQSGRLKVLCGCFEVWQGGAGWFLVAGAGRGCGPIPVTIGRRLAAPLGFAFGTSVWLTFWLALWFALSLALLPGGSRFFAAGGGFFIGFPGFGTAFGLGGIFLRLEGEEGQPEGGGDRGSEKGARTFEGAGDEHVMNGVGFPPKPDIGMTPGRDGSNVSNPIARRLLRSLS